MKILTVGDVVARPGREHLARRLRRLKQEMGIDLCIVNGENATHGLGLNRDGLEALLQAGSDVVTLGNHTFGQREMLTLLEESHPLVRPANFPPSTPGEGYYIYDMGRICVGVISLLGRVGMEAVDCPFRTADALIRKLQDQCRILMVDIHGEATSEKMALAHYLDGRVSGVFGTHTHVQTADEQILPKGTGYLTDLGMTGVIHSVIGMEVEQSIGRFVTRMPHRYEAAEGPTMLNAAVWTIDEQSGRTVSIQRIFERE